MIAISMARRSRFVLLVAGLLLAACANSRAAEAEDKAVELPLDKVVLFSSGVGFYQHDGKIDGNGRVDLKFNIEDINDLLKSMVLQDLGGGKISTVTYGSKDPITKTLKTFAIDLTRNLTLADLLRQIRGERISIDAPKPIEGKILGVEHRVTKVGKDDSVDSQILVLATKTGLRNVPLDTVVEVRLVDEKLNDELQQALAILAMSHATDKKTVTLNFRGNGQRDVRVGYIQESPIWKTSYRLVLDDEEPLLQGWAIVENTTEQDWSKVALTLVSGRPISFIMDLYQPLYVSRPVVVPELYSSLTPKTYDQDLASREARFLRRGKAQAGMGGGGGFFGGGGGGLGGGGGGGGFGGSFGGVGGGRGEPDDTPSPQPKPKPAPLKPGQGVESAAAAEDVGELFRYVIEAPVSLPRQQSAMLPIVNGKIKAEKFSIFNRAVHAKHPLNGLKLTNSTDLHLMQGPITVFDDGAYAGDARIEDLPPKADRLISYALDLNTEVAETSDSEPRQLVSVTLSKGAIHTKQKSTRSHDYVVKNSSDKAKQILVELPIDKAWTLVDSKQPLETTRDLYRFLVAAKPGEAAKLSVAEERTQQENYAIIAMADDAIAVYAKMKTLSPAVKQAFAEIIKRRRAVAAAADKRETLASQIRTVETEQTRIRENMAQLDRNGDLYKRYVGKFAKQEDQVEKLRADLLAAQGEDAGFKKLLEDYVADLDLE